MSELRVRSPVDPLTSDWPVTAAVNVIAIDEVVVLEISATTSV